jgi:hypothetical protein
MPDLVLLTEALAVAAGLAAGIVLACGWRASQETRINIGSVVAVSAAFFAGCWLLDARPRWPPRVAQDRLLTILLPFVILVELLAALPQGEHWLTWVRRLVIACAAAPVILYGSTHLQGDDAWSAGERVVIFGLLAAALVLAWCLFLLLLRQSSPQVEPPSYARVLLLFPLAVTCTGAGVVVMLSGYATGGILLLPLAAAVIGTAGAASLFRNRPVLHGVAGFAVVTLFAILVSGRFFASLTTPHAVVLFFTPLLCWLTEWPLQRRRNPWLRCALQCVVVIIPIAVVAFQAQQNIEQPDTGGDEPSLKDYTDFGR